MKDNRFKDNHWGNHNAEGNNLANNLSLAIETVNVDGYLKVTMVFGKILFYHIIGHRYGIVFKPMILRVVVRHQCKLYSDGWKGRTRRREQKQGREHSERKRARNGKIGTIAIKCLYKERIYKVFGNRWDKF